MRSQTKAVQSTITRPQGGLPDKLVSDDTRRHINVPKTTAAILLGGVVVTKLLYRLLQWRSERARARGSEYHLRARRLETWRHTILANGAPHHVAQFRELLGPRLARTVPTAHNPTFERDLLERSRTHIPPETRELVWVSQARRDEGGSTVYKMITAVFGGGQRAIISARAAATLGYIDERGNVLPEFRPVQPHKFHRYYRPELKNGDVIKDLWLSFGGERVNMEALVCKPLSNRSRRGASNDYPALRTSDRLPCDVEECIVLGTSAIASIEQGLNLRLPRS